MDNGSQIGLTLRRLPEGGYVVCDMHEWGQFTSEHYASTSIDDALKFMRDKIAPKPPTIMAAGTQIYDNLGSAALNMCGPRS